MRNLLVIGAVGGSIGDYVASEATRGTEWEVQTCGRIDEEPKWTVDLSDPLDGDTQDRIEDIVFARPWHAVVCTVGVNEPGRLLGESEDVISLVKLRRHFMVNVLGPLAFLEKWLEYWKQPEEVTGPGYENLHFAIVSSNSAQVPRRNSLPYNTTKAALSMAVQCAARDIADEAQNVSIYGYEPGWVQRTPMSTEVKGRIGGGPVTRAPGGRTLEREELARMIVRNLEFGPAINGSLIRVDGGEA